MSMMLGKRKRRNEVLVGKKRAGAEMEQIVVEEESSGSEAELDAQEIFRRHFEAQFEPLPELKKARHLEDKDFETEDSDEDGDDWEGISEEDDTSVQIIEHSSSSKSGLMSKEELKRFMSSRPPTDATSLDDIFSKVSKSASAKFDDPTEATNLKNDLALQRLLAESHLLDAASASSSLSTEPSGANRHKATDLRLRALGAKTSILEQKNMPMGVRKGIVKKKETREEARRKEAKENGIILEVAKKKRGTIGDGFNAAGKRDRGIGAPGVGRFKGGTLSLSKKDVRDIEGPKRGGDSRGGRGGGGRGRGKKR